MGKVKISKETIGLRANQDSEPEIINKYRISLTERIVRNLAHEIRNPLTNVMLGMEQLKNECPPENETAEVYFDIIKRNCDRINDLITALVNAAKPADLSMSPQSINQIMDDVLSLSQEKMDAQGLKVVKRYGEQIPDIKLDPDKIREALKNVVDNAVNAMSGIKGQLELKTDYQDDKCIVTIKDNGMGIQADDMKKIFDPFFRVRSNGAGLGLTSAQNIITNHNGKIHVESVPGEGTSITITLLP
jgi:two-component system, sporulation sensor kinase E